MKTYNFSKQKASLTEAGFLLYVLSPGIGPGS